ncbi:unnamed protein product, partial [Laminaria digitata]
MQKIQQFLRGYRPPGICMACLLVLTTTASVTANAGDLQEAMALS